MKLHKHKIYICVQFHSAKWQYINEFLYIQYMKYNVSKVGMLNVFCYTKQCLLVKPRT